MVVAMYSYKFIAFFMLVVFGMNAWSYGSSSSKKTCKKPKFTHFMPPHLTAVEPQAKFSFIASAVTNPKSIEVSLKNQPVNISIDKKRSGYLVSARLPKTSRLQSDFVRINIRATSKKTCRANAGWLLKIKAATP